MEEAAVEKIYAAEKSLAAIRLAMNSCVYLFIMGWTDTIPWPAHFIMAAAFAYSVSVLLFQPYRQFPLLLSSYFTSVSDATFISLWILATGGIHSPFYVLWYASLTAIAFRYNYRETLLAAVLCAVSYLVLLASLGELAGHLTEVTVRTSYIFVIAVLGGSLAREAYRQTRDKVELQNLVRRLDEEIAQHQRTEETLREQEVRYRSLFENANDAIVTFTLDGTITAVNRGLEVTLGWSREELLGQHYRKIVAPASAAQGEERTRRALAGEKLPPTFEAEMVRKDGSVAPIECRTRFMYDQGGKLIGAQGIYRDITARKQAEEALRQSEERYRTVVGGAPIVLFAVDRQGVLTLSEGKGLRALGREPGESVGQSVFELYRDVPQIVETIRRALAGEEFTAVVEVAGSVFESWYSPLRDQSGAVTSVIGVSTDITARRRAEETLLKQTEILQSILNNMGDAVIVADENEKFLVFNPAAERMFGVGATDTTTKEWSEQYGLYLPDTVTPFPADELPLTRAIRGEAVNEVEMFVRHGQAPDGVWAQITGRPFTDKDGGLKGGVIVCRDVTERKQMEEKLKTERDYTSQIIHGTPALVCGISPEGTTTCINPAVGKITGYTAAELIGKNWWQILYPGEEYQQVAQLFRAFAQGAVHDYEMVLTTKTGEKRTVAWNSLNRFDEHGVLLEIVGFGNDITERKRAEEALLRSERFNASLIAQSPIGIITYLPDGHTASVNRAWEQMWGVTWEQVQDYNLFTDPQLVCAPLHEALERLVQQGGETPSFELEYDMTTLSGGNKRWASSKFYAVQDENGGITQLVCLNENITVRKRMEAELKQAKEAAEAANRAKSEFLANMSHEIRTPMNGVIGMAELLLDTELAPEQREYATTVHSSAEALLGVLNDILDFSKIEARKLDLERVDFRLRESLGDAMKVLALQAHEKGLELCYQVQPDVPDALVGDPTRLRQVLVNLIGNAIKFTAQGEVAVEVQRLASKAQDSESSSLTLDSRPQTLDPCVLHFTVRDTGIGIPPDKQRLIFDAFSQADTSTTRQYGGTGLGLSISRQLVEMMGGRMWMESAVGKGTTFHVIVRLSKGHAPAECLPVHPHQLQGLPVLIVDDNATNRRILQELLCTWQMHPTVVAGAREALAVMQHAQAQGRSFPLILLDAHMPEMDGFALAARIKQDPQLAGATIMMLTSAEQRVDAERCRQLGLAAYLIKPITSAELLWAILRAVGQAEAGEATTAAKPRARQSQRPLHILLAEDNAVNQKLAVRLLEKWGHAVVVAGNGREALAALEHQGFDAVLMDVQMPELDGLEATAAIRAAEQTTGAHVSIIAMTAHAMKGDKERCLAAGMDGYVAKPLKPAELLAALETVAVQALHHFPPASPWQEAVV